MNRAATDDGCQCGAEITGNTCWPATSITTTLFAAVESISSHDPNAAEWSQLIASIVAVPDCVSADVALVDVLGLHYSDSDTDLRASRRDHVVAGRPGSLAIARQLVYDLTRTPQTDAPTNPQRCGPKVIETRVPRQHLAMLPRQVKLPRPPTRWPGGADRSTTDLAARPLTRGTPRDAPLRTRQPTPMSISGTQRHNGPPLAVNVLEGRPAHRTILRELPVAGVRASANPRRNQAVRPAQPRRSSRLDHYGNGWVAPRNPIASTPATTPSPRSTRTSCSTPSTTLLSCSPCSAARRRHRDFGQGRPAARRGVPWPGRRRQAVGRCGN
jgi:hypothetical protein